MTVNWLVTVKGWAPTRANGIMPSRLANRMNMKTVKTQGMYLRPSGPMLVVTIELTKPVTPSTIDLPAAGHELALHSAEHEQPDQREDDEHPQGAVGEDEGLPSRLPASGLIWNWCIGSILLSAATLQLPSARHSGFCCEIFQTSHMATPNPRNSIATQIPCVPASRSITQPISALPSGS